MSCSPQRPARAPKSSYEPEANTKSLPRARSQHHNAQARTGYRGINIRYDYEPKPPVFFCVQRQVRLACSGPQGFPCFFTSFLVYKVHVALELCLSTVVCTHIQPSTCMLCAEAEPDRNEQERSEREAQFRWLALGPRICKSLFA